MGETFANYLSDKGLISRIYRGLIELNNIKRKKKQFKNEQRT